MKRATTASIREFIYDNFTIKDGIGPFIPGTEVQRLMDELMQNFDGIYCGVKPHEVAGRLFVVRSAKTLKHFAEVRVK